MTDFRERDFKEPEQHEQLSANTKSIASDIAGATSSRDAASKTPLGVVPSDYNVRSTYDSRPVQGFDFNIATVSDSCTGAGLQQFVVPDGYVAVIREVQIVCEPMRVVSSINDIQASLVVDNVDVRYNANIPIGNGTRDPIKAFFVADEKHLVGVRIIDNGGVMIAGDKVRAIYYGNLLAKTGRPAPLEVANYAGRALVTGQTQFTAAPSQPVERLSPIPEAIPEQRQASPVFAPPSDTSHALRSARGYSSANTPAPKGALKSSRRVSRRY